MNDNQSNVLKIQIGYLLNNQWFSAVHRYKNGDFVETITFPAYGGLNKCPEHIQSHYNKEYLIQTKAEPKSKRSKYELKAFKKELQNNCITNECIRQSLAILKRRRIVLQGIRADGKPFFAEGYAKGTQRYNKKYKFKIIDYIKEMQNAGMETFALTITADLAQFGNNYLIAWSEYSKAMQETLENLRKHKGAKYVGIKESTKKGAPHAHIVLGFPKGTVKGYDKMKNRQRLWHGDLVDEIKKRTRSRIFRLEKVDGNNVKFYLTKYVSKFADIDIFKLSDKKGELSTEERKACICTLATIATNTRQFIMTRNTQRKTNKEISVCSEKEIESFEEQRKKEIDKNIQDWYKFHTISKGTAERRAISARLRAYLISLCTNSPCTRTNTLRIISRDRFDSIVKENMSDFLKSDTEKEMIFIKHGKDISCKGCVFSDFVNFMTNAGSNYFSEQFTEEEINDDELFMDKLRAVWCNLYEKLVNERTGYYDILKEHHKKHWF